MVRLAVLPESVRYIKGSLTRRVLLMLYHMYQQSDSTTVVFQYRILHRQSYQSRCFPIPSFDCFVSYTSCLVLRLIFLILGLHLSFRLAKHSVLFIQDLLKDPGRLRVASREQPDLLSFQDLVALPATSCIAPATLSSTYDAVWR